MSAKRTSKAGFTLLEIAVSISILALMALMISRIFNESTRAVEQGKDQVLLDGTARLLLDYIEQDVSQALVRTNVAFRVHSVDGNDALYFISPAVRRELAGIPRDTAAMRLQLNRVSTLNQYISAFSPDAASGTQNSTLLNLIRHSDYYYDEPAVTAADFQPVHGEGESTLTEGKFTQAIDSTLGHHAVVTFMDILVNADSSRADNEDRPPDPADMPRFVDVVIGLIDSGELQQAIRFDDIGNSTRAQEYIEQHERIFTRRIFMRNTGTETLSF